MSAPRFSVLVPTRQRPETLKHTLATVLAQERDDFEVIVADNCGGPETRQVVESFGSKLLQHARSDQVLPMAENWERGLSLCRGEYVTVLGDDDALLPSSLASADKLIRTTGAEVLSWRPHVYWWPDTIASWLRNLLFLKFGNGASWIQSRPVLEQFYSGELGFIMVPAIYWSFFHRRILDEGRRRHGAFFVPTDAPPDVASGILALHLTERFAYSTRALSLRGNSGRSNGTAQWMRSLGGEQRETYYREERVGLRGMVHHSLVPSPNLTIFIASTKLKCKELYFPNDDVLAVDLRGVVQAMLAELNLDPNAYEDNLRDALALAEKIDMHIEPNSIPPRRPVTPSAHSGLIVDDGSIEGIVVNCNKANIYTIAEAARLVDAIMPPVEIYLEDAGKSGKTLGAESYSSGQAAPPPPEETRGKWWSRLRPKTRR